MSDLEAVTREKCWSDGITCRSCVGHAARSVAALCPNMTPTQSGQTFRRMFEATDCLFNETEFKWAYAVACGQPDPLAERLVQLGREQAA